MALSVIACFALAPSFPSFFYTSCSTLHPRCTLITRGFIVEARNCEKRRTLQPSTPFMTFSPSSVYICLALLLFFNIFFTYVCLGSYTLVFVFYFYHPNRSRITEPLKRPVNKTFCFLSGASR